MPQLQSVVLTDREATPVNHTFTPRSKTNGVAMVAEAGTTIVGENSLTISMRKTPSGKYRGRLVLTLPVVATEVINGVSAPSVIRRAIAAVDVTFESTSTLQERKNLVGMLASSLATGKVLIEDTFTKAEEIW